MPNSLAINARSVTRISLFSCESVWRGQREKPAGRSERVLVRRKSSK
jgi:hypothetical protein